MGSGIGSIESALEQLFREAQREISLTVYSLSNSADQLFDWLETALARGVEVKLLINRFESQPSDVVARLRQLVEMYPHFYLFDFQPQEGSDLHAKTITADRRIALVGSSNLSKRGLLSNHELAVSLQGPAASSVASALDRLMTNQYASRVAKS
jgi:cardiolipin synthase